MFRTKLVLLAAVAALVAGAAGTARGQSLPFTVPGPVSCGDYFGASNTITAQAPGAAGATAGDHVAAGVFLYRWTNGAWHQAGQSNWMWAQAGPSDIMDDWRSFDTGQEIDPDFQEASASFQNLQPGYYAVVDYIYFYSLKQWTTVWDDDPSGPGSTGNYYCQIGG